MSYQLVDATLSRVTLKITHKFFHRLGDPVIPAQAGIQWHVVPSTPATS